MSASTSYCFEKVKTPSGAIILSLKNNPLAEKAGDDGVAYHAAKESASTCFNRHSSDFIGLAKSALHKMEKILWGIDTFPEDKRRAVLQGAARQYLGYIRDNAGLFWFPLAEKFALRCLDFIEMIDQTDRKNLFLIKSYLGCLSLSLMRQGEDFRLRPDLMEAYMAINQACLDYSRDHFQSSIH